MRIIETYKPELSSSVFDYVPGTAGASAPTSLVGSPVSSGMFTPNTLNIYNAQPGSSSGSLTIGYKTINENWFEGRCLSRGDRLIYL